MPRVPSYRLHKPSGQAVVTLGGKDHYLGRHGTPESKRRYDELLASFLLGGRRPAAPQPGLTVAQLVESYREHVEGPESPYQKRGKLTGQVKHIRTACRALVRLFGSLPADLLTPAQLRAYARHLLREEPCRTAPGGKGWSLDYARGALGIVKQLWGWAAQEGAVSGATAQGLRVVKMPRANTPGVRTMPPVRPAALADVEAALPHLPAPARALLRLAYLAGLRPAEARGLTPADLGRDGTTPEGDRFEGLWVYVVADAWNKNAHHGQRRLCFLGPRAQAVLTPLLENRAPGAPAFCPAEEGGESDAPMYAPERLAKLLRKACRAAGVPQWRPNQLRHLRATEIRSRFGSDAARVVLGHALPGVTGVYAEPDLRKAADVMREIG